MHLVAPSCSQKLHLSREPAVAYTVAPKLLASWIAVVPIPPLPPCINTVSPGFNSASWNRLCQTVNTVSGRQAAARKSRLSGIGRQCSASTATYSAYPPPATSAHTGSPIAHLSTLRPHAATVPATSRP